MKGLTKWQAVKMARRAVRAFAKEKHANWLRALSNLTVFSLET